MAQAASDRERAREIVRRLARAYRSGHPARPDTSVVGSVVKPPLDELIFTLLSQHTSDLNRDRAWVSLRERFPAWEQVASARTKSIADAIRIGGLADSKAPRIKAVLREVREREGSYGLERLRRMSDDDVRHYLLSLPGIGPKTAACVLAFSLARPALPVDTHVHRLAIRLGFAGPKADAAATQQILESLVPGRSRLATHVRLIAHGRMICTARRPKCGECVLADLCPSAARLA
ncbi:MAG TPA: endonuclease III [Actinomycetota bacterium]|nr:endonuclease III [Actinomycetota bacterium]